MGIGRGSGGVGVQDRKDLRPGHRAPKDLSTYGCTQPAPDVDDNARRARDAADVVHLARGGRPLQAGHHAAAPAEWSRRKN